MPSREDEGLLLCPERHLPPATPTHPAWQAANEVVATSGSPISDLPAAMAAQPNLQDSLRTLLFALLERTRAQRAVLVWYDDGHAAEVFEARAAGHGDLPSWHPMPAPDALLKDAVEEAVDQGVALPSPGADFPDSPWMTRAQQALARATSQAVCTLPLPGGPQPLGAVLLGWADTDARRHALDKALLTALLHSVAPLLAVQRRAERPWHWHARQAWRQWHARRSRQSWWPVALLAALALALVPLPEHIGGRARIEGAQQRVLSAPTDGFIKAMHAHPGDRVKAGQVLADLAEQDLKLERDRWASQIAQQDNAYAAAMTRADRAEAALSLSRLEEAQAQLALIDEQLKRSQLKAPFDGVLIQGDLSQSIGAPVKQGDALMTVATTHRYRVIIDIDEADIARVKVAQHGQMALSALPWDTQALQVVRITPLGVAREGRNVFEVQADFEGPLTEDLRPGLMGTAKVQVGWRPLLWSWLRPLVNRLRFLWWAW